MNDVARVIHHGIILLFIQGGRGVTGQGLSDQVKS